MGEYADDVIDAGLDEWIDNPPLRSTTQNRRKRPKTIQELYAESFGEFDYDDDE